MEPARLIAAFVFCALASAQDAGAPRAGSEALKAAERVFALGNPEQARVEVERAIAEMLAARPDAQDAEDDRALRDAGALAYKLRSMEPARRAWDAVRRYREKTLDPASLELQNARGNVSWIGEQMGLVAEARVLEEQIVAALEKSLPADADALATARGNLGDTLLQQGESARALELFTQVANVRRVKLPDGHPQRLRTELDVACGLVATGDAAAGERIFQEVLRAAAPDAFSVRLRAATALVMSIAARSDPTPGVDRTALSAAIQTLDEEVRAAAKPVGALEWRAAEIRTAELQPFVDVLISAHFGFGCIPAQELRRPPPTTASNPPPPYGSIVEFHRWERSRIEVDGADCRVLADERLAALAPGVGWIDLGPLADARRLVQSWSDAAQRGDARAEAQAVTRALFAPVAAAIGNPSVLAIVPDDVIWAVPLHSLDLRTDDGSAVTVEAALRGPGPFFTDSRGECPWIVFGDPRVELDPKSGDRLHAGGAAAAFVSERPQALEASTAAWRRRLGANPGEHVDTGVESFRGAAYGCAILTSPLWAAPDDVPRAASPRPVVPASPLAAALSREDVFGGSAAGDLCGILFTGYGAASWENGRRQCALRAADLRSPGTLSQERLFIASPPPRADVVLRARDIEALARAFVAAGFADLCLATQEVRDVERATFPGDLEKLIQRATPVPESTVPGPWLRLRAGPR